MSVHDSGAEHFELETALHGGLQAFASGDMAAVIAAQGPDPERTGDLARVLATRSWPA